LDIKKNNKHNFSTFNYLFDKLDSLENKTNKKDFEQSFEKRKIVSRKKTLCPTAHNKNGEFIAETRVLCIFRKVKV
jgi:hypothetical protein